MLLQLCSGRIIRRSAPAIPEFDSPPRCCAVDAGVGAAIGAIAGGGKGAAIGAAAGGGAGAATVLATRGEAADIPAETVLSFRLTAPAKITITP